MEKDSEKNMEKNRSLHFFGGSMALIAGLTAGLFANYQTDQRPVDIDGDGKLDTVSTYLFGPPVVFLAREENGETVYRRTSKEYWFAWGREGKEKADAAERKIHENLRKLGLISD